MEPIGNHRLLCPEPHIRATFPQMPSTALESTSDAPKLCKVVCGELYLEVNAKNWKQHPHHSSCHHVNVVRCATAHSPILAMLEAATDHNIRSSGPSVHHGLSPGRLLDLGTARAEDQPQHVFRIFHVRSDFLGYVKKQSPICSGTFGSPLSSESANLPSPTD